ncbi:MAG: type I restriction enzyme HsdR N-terminal domain-containing protein [Helicobacteraceae bacterium]|jgi:tRNA G10  N-methylase Trm11|nr:type I restriction enzyme HsdR N-terminal domain-containing protein [Helicobacteraceae bacterium]
MSENIKEKLFGALDFNAIADNGDFKEDSVREVIIAPILKELGYSQENIIRSKQLRYSYLKIGSAKKIPITIIPDYLLRIGDCYACVLDAKAPNKKIVNDENVAQVYSYATHPEIRAVYFSLCNGAEFSLFRTSGTNIPIIYFEIADIEKHWKLLSTYLSPNSFQSGKNITYIPETIKTQFDYLNRPLLEEISVKKRAAKRHFGVHGYFTRQSWNIVQAYIKNYSRPGDLVLDPFGGSGVTVIEALMAGRKGINIDLNPMAVFLVTSLIAPVNFADFAAAFIEVQEEYLKNEPKTKEEINKALKKYNRTKVLPLAKGSDVETTDQLFSDKQMAQLGLLKSIILKQKNENIKASLLLAFSGVITRANLTYHISTAIEAGTGFGGDASAMRYYRYRIAPDPKDIDIMRYFRLRYKKVCEAKREISVRINENAIANAQIIKGTAADLSFLRNESVDYIYTDPPYGKKIPYLDLSVMWNAWLDLEVTEEDYAQEAIEGGERDKSKEEYNELISQSIKEMYRVLKFDRWLSFVFAHKDPEFWHLIINSAESCGFEYIGAISQKNGQTSFKKRQNPFTVLSGQLIINFRKVRNPRAFMKANLGMNITEIVTQTIEGIIAKENGATLEQINDELIIKGLELGFLDLLKKYYTDLTSALIDNFDYDDKSEKFYIKKDSKFTTHISVELRIKYYLISYLRRKEKENKNASFDDIVLEILPLLRNGVTPKEQTILSVLEDIAARAEDGSWRLGRKGLQTFQMM